MSDKGNLDERIGVRMKRMRDIDERRRVDPDAKDEGEARTAGHVIREHLFQDWNEKQQNERAVKAKGGQNSTRAALVVRAYVREQVRAEYDDIAGRHGVTFKDILGDLAGDGRTVVFEGCEYRIWGDDRSVSQDPTGEGGEPHREVSVSTVEEYFTAARQEIKES